MKKIIFILLSLVLLSPSVSAAGNQKENWYFVMRNKNTRPELPRVNETYAKGIGNDEKVLYLTFDAGYENGNVEKIVEALEESQTQGAFFILKHFAEKNPELLRRIAKNNLIGNHTSRHPCIVGLSDEELKNELETVAEICEQTTGQKMSPFFRPPEGTYSENALKKVYDLGYRTVFWSVAYADWDNSKQPDPAAALEKLESRVHNGAVILLHPTSETNAKILPQFISDMKDAGYRFGSLEELWAA